MKNWFSWWHNGRKRFWILLTLVFFLFLVIRKNNIFTWVAGWIEEGSQKREIKALEREIYELDEGISQMNEGTDAAEKYARENLHFQADGEDVYVVEE